MFVLKSYKIDHICLLDSDVYFLSSPNFVFNLLSKYSIIITPHKFSIENKDLINYGLYNVSFQLFYNNKVGNDCLNLWRKQCINWCKDYLDAKNNRFGDQLYLNEWPILYKNNIYVLEEPTCGLAPWNFNNYNIEFKDNCYTIENKKVVFIHFHGLNNLNNFVIKNSFSHYNVLVYNNLIALYKSYLNQLELIKFNISKSHFFSIRKTTSKNIIRLIINERTIFIKIFNNFKYFDLNFIFKLWQR